MGCLFTSLIFNNVQTTICRRCYVCRGYSIYKNSRREAPTLSHCGTGSVKEPIFLASVLDNRSLLEKWRGQGSGGRCWAQASKGPTGLQRELPKTNGEVKSSLRPIWFGATWPGDSPDFLSPFPFPSVLSRGIKQVRSGKLWKMDAGLYLPWKIRVGERSKEAWASTGSRELSPSRLYSDLPH